MQKIESIKNMADIILSDKKPLILPDEINSLLSLAESNMEKELYIELYNFFLRKNSEEVIKNGKF